MHRHAQCCPVLPQRLGLPWCLGLLVVSRTQVCWPPEERDRRHLKEGEGSPPPQGRRGEEATTQKAPTGETQKQTNNDTQRHITPPTTHNNTTTRRSVHLTTPQSLSPVCLLILVCCLLPLVSVSVLSVLPRFCHSVCVLDARLLVRMSVSVRLFVCLSP